MPPGPVWCARSARWLTAPQPCTISCPSAHAPMAAMRRHSTASNPGGGIRRELPRTAKPSLSSLCTSAEPTNPVAPVTNTFTGRPAALAALPSGANGSAYQRDVLLYAALTREMTRVIVLAASRPLPQRRRACRRRAEDSGHSLDIAGVATCTAIGGANHLRNVTVGTDVQHRNSTRHIAEQLAWHDDSLEARP